MSIATNYVVLAVSHERRRPAGYDLDVTVVAKTYHKPKWVVASHTGDRHHSEYKAKCGTELDDGFILLSATVVEGSNIQACRKCWP